eukprot:TRINITY_DN729_c0_g1_i1.p1 TRINITY_DN729_c0_g1~~TRINITY_DN729_c0_g1_i1.p1  ORF type:complete len:165 (-),score=0.55 TRINITY_DN729_c0_g1_i1:92-586(-)
MVFFLWFLIFTYKILQVISLEVEIGMFRKCCERYILQVWYVKLSQQTMQGIMYYTFSNHVRYLIINKTIFFFWDSKVFQTYFLGSLHQQDPEAMFFKSMIIYVYVQRQTLHKKLCFLIFLFFLGEEIQYDVNPHIFILAFVLVLFKIYFILYFNDQLEKSGLKK